jgi:hypothetical protein
VPDLSSLSDTPITAPAPADTQKSPFACIAIPTHHGATVRWTFPLPKLRAGRLTGTVVAIASTLAMALACASADRDADCFHSLRSGGARCTERGEGELFCRVPGGNDGTKSCPPPRRCGNQRSVAMGMGLRHKRAASDGDVLRGARPPPGLCATVQDRRVERGVRRAALARDGRSRRSRTFRLRRRHQPAAGRLAAAA